MPKPWDHEEMWKRLYANCLELLSAASHEMLTIDEKDPQELAREYATRQGRWLAMQDVLAWMKELEECPPDEEEAQ